MSKKNALSPKPPRSSPLLLLSLSLFFFIQTISHSSALNFKNPFHNSLSSKTQYQKPNLPSTLNPFSIFQAPKQAENKPQNGPENKPQNGLENKPKNKPEKKPRIKPEIESKVNPFSLFKTLENPEKPQKNVKNEYPKGLGNPTDILPEYVGSLYFDKISQWEGPCFQSTVGYLNFSSQRDEKEDLDIGAVLNLEVRSPASWLCMDLYAFATPFRLTADYFFFQGRHKFQIVWMDPNERSYVMEKGISVFLMPRGFFGTLRGLWDVAPLLSNTWLGEAAQRSFLERKMGAKFVARDPPWATDLLSLPPSLLSLSLPPGSLLVTSKMRGPWGAFETIQKWASGSWSGHVAMILRGEEREGEGEGEGEILVAESGYYNEKGEPIIAVLPFADWWTAQLKDKSLPHIAILPLHSSLLATWNHTAALSFVREMEGKKFGYHNIVFSWIDTPNENFPPPIDSQLVAALASMWVRVQPEYAGNLWKEALNKRLGTQDLEFPGILAECNRREMSFGELLSIPENDNWVYSDGISTSCVAFVLSVWKRAGIFGNFSDVVQATEFTIRDAYNLKVFEDDLQKLPDWCKSQKEKLPYCQILGKWRFDLPGFNTQNFYPHMNERCPSLPPDYFRPPDC